jgi:hypothetical protein
MKVYQKDKLPTNIDVAKDEISTTEVIYSSPSTLRKCLHRSRSNLKGTKIKTCRESIIRATRQYLGEEIGDHVFRNAEMQNHVAIDDHSTYQMISDLNMPNFTHPLTIGCNAKAGLRVRVDRVGFRAKKSQETKHVFNMDHLLTADTGRNELGRASRVHVSRLLNRSPHDRSAE